MTSDLSENIECFVRFGHCDGHTDCVFNTNNQKKYLLFIYLEYILIIYQLFIKMTCFNLCLTNKKSNDLWRRQ